jgi:hypothetical protein
MLSPRPTMPARARNTLETLSMAKYLDEDETGTDAHKIGFPHLLLCQGVVCVMSNGHLIGGHFTSGSSEGSVASAMQGLINANGSGISRIYVAYDSRKKPASAADARGKAALFNFRGTVYYFDTSRIKPADGTYVEVSSVAGGRCLVQYKRNEKMSYASGAKIPGTNKSATTGAQLKPTASKMHKAGHIMGMTKITV